MNFKGGGHRLGEGLGTMQYARRDRRRLHVPSVLPVETGKDEARQSVGQLREAPAGRDGESLFKSVPGASWTFQLIPPFYSPMKLKILLKNENKYNVVQFL